MNSLDTNVLVYVVSGEGTPGGLCEPVALPIGAEAAAAFLVPAHGARVPG